MFIPGYPVQEEYLVSMPAPPPSNINENVCWIKGRMTAPGQPMSVSPQPCLSTPVLTCWGHRNKAADWAAYTTEMCSLRAGGWKSEI